MSDRGLTTSDAGAAVTTSVTVTVMGVTPEAVTTTAPVYVPAVSKAGATDTVTVEGAVPEVADTLSQEPVEVTAAVQAKPALPVLEMAMVCEAGSAPPTVYAYC